MTSTASATARGRDRGLIPGLRWLGDPRPYVFLALLTALLLSIVYTIRPTVRVDLGGDHDAIFLQNFHRREIGANGPITTIAWPADQATLTIPGGRNGEWMAILRAAPGQPPDMLYEAAVAVNDLRVKMPRRTADSIVTYLPAELVAAETLTFSLVSPLVGDPPPPLGMVGEILLAPARTYRWSQAESAVVLPYLGRGNWLVKFNVVTRHPDGTPLGATITPGDHPAINLPESGTQRRVQLLVPATALRDGSLTLTVRSKVYYDPRPLGLMLSSLVVGPAGELSPSLLIPPLGGLFLAWLTILGAFITLQIAVGGVARLQGWRATPTLWITIGLALVAIVGSGAMIVARFPSSFMLPRLAALAVGSALLALILRLFSQRLFTFVGAPLAADEPAQIPPKARMRGERMLSILLVIVMISFWLKAIGVIYPYFVAIDVNWHMTRAQWILNGSLPLLYSTNSPLNDTTMPTAEWGENRPVIPYSPWFHMLATLFAFVPFMSMDMAANLTSLLLDSSRIILITLIALRAGLSRRAALLAGATYAVLPVAFLLHSWGNLPTTFGLWLTLVCNTIIICAWDRLHERRVMITLSVLLLATLLLYTVTGVFMGLFLVLLTILVWLNALRGTEWASLRRQLAPLWSAAGVAIALAILIYYGQYIPLIIQQTLPYMQTVFTQGPQSVGVVRPPFGSYLWTFIPHLDYRIWPGDYLYYGLAIPLIFMIPGFIAMRERLLPWIAFAAWGSLALLFMLAGYRISMVDKQLFYLVPVICVCWALCAERIWARWNWGPWAVSALLIYSLYAALDQWLIRIATSRVID